jgi:heptosyltransferase-2
MNHVVLVQTAFLGDLFLSLPLLKRVRRLWPLAQISLVCRSGLGPFFLETQFVNHVYEIKKGDASSYRAVERELNQREIDLVIAPHISLRTALFCLKLRAREKVSFRKLWNNFVFGKRLNWPGALPEALRQLFLLTPWDSELLQNFKDLNCDFSIKNESGRLPLVPDWASMKAEWKPQKQSDWLPKKISVEERKAIQKARDENRLILIFPGSVWATKRWTRDGFLQLATDLQNDRWHILWMGGAGEEVLAGELAGQLPGSSVLAGRTSVLESCQIMLQSRLVICNDSAASHLASAADVPVLSIFGPTVLKFGYRPWSSQAYVVERTGLECRPCGKHGAPKCPIKTHVCMTQISAEEVFKQAKLILSRKVSGI